LAAPQSAQSGEETQEFQGTQKPKGLKSPGDSNRRTQADVDGWPIDGDTLLLLLLLKLSHAQLERLDVGAVLPVVAHLLGGLEAGQLDAVQLLLGHVVEQELAVPAELSLELLDPQLQVMGAGQVAADATRWGVRALSHVRR